MITNHNSFEALIKDYIRPGIVHEMQSIVDEEIARAEEHLRKRLREVLANTAIKLKEATHAKEK